jgi:hypothetical protein
VLRLYMQGGAYATGSFTVPTGQYIITAKRVTLTGAQRITTLGTARWKHV